VHSLYCCPATARNPVTMDATNCKTITSGFGGKVDCTSKTPIGLTVHVSCSSGLWYNWWGGPGAGGGRVTADVVNRVDCCPASYKGLAVGPRGDNDCGEWIYGVYGQDLTCAKDHVLMGRCGSGADRDCYNTDSSWSSHGIKCCKMFIR
jgi:hypothetical protein